MKDRLEENTDTSNVKILRDEIQFTIEHTNSAFGMPTDIHNILRNVEITGDKWAIVDFSHITEKENGHYKIEVYIKPFVAK